LQADSGKSVARRRYQEYFEDPFLRNGALFMDTAKLKWNILFANAGSENNYDTWLEQYLPLLREVEGPALDLGCGLGNATNFLLGKGIETVSCDFSSTAVAHVRKKFPRAKALIHDMRNRLPFAAGSFGIVVADLSIHYFPWGKTMEIMDEIARILKKEGIFLFRVNSIADDNYGAGRGKELERHYYAYEGSDKRFFDEKDIDMLITEKWRRIKVAEACMDRYGKEKQVWEVALAKC
jgi:SAM-dependent methyltransferase